MGLYTLYFYLTFIVRLPGWRVDNKCSKDTNGRSLQCMNYAKDAHVASNVGCVASCEAERVKSYEDASKLDEVARTEGNALDKNKKCLLIGKKLDDRLHRITNFIKAKRRQLNKLKEKFDEIKKLNLEEFKIKEVHSKTTLNEIDDPRCLVFSWESNWKDWETSAHQWRVKHKKRCFNGFFVKNMTVFMMDRRYLKNEIKTLAKLEVAMEGKYPMYDRILNRTGKNSKSRDMNKWEDAFTKCGNDSEVKMGLVERRSVIETLSPLKGGMFTIFQQSTLDSFHKRSPWQISNDKDAFKYFTGAERKGLNQNFTINQEPTCNAARRTTTMFHEIAHYIRQWIQEQKSAKRTFSSVKDTLGREVEKADRRLQILRSNSSTDMVDLMQYWTQKAKYGMKRWLSGEEQRIVRHNIESIPLIRRELELVYTGGEHATLEDLFTQKSSIGERALKRANIETSADNTFSELSKSLLSYLQSGGNLDQLSVPVEDAIKRIEGLSKRTILCTH